MTAPRRQALDRMPLVCLLINLVATVSAIGLGRAEFLDCGLMRFWRAFLRHTPLHRSRGLLHVYYLTHHCPIRPTTFFIRHQLRSSAFLRSTFKDDPKLLASLAALARKLVVAPWVSQSTSPYAAVSRRPHLVCYVIVPMGSRINQADKPRLPQTFSE